MKRFWVVLLAAALVAGFAVSASAMDVKFNGSYYVLGAHADNWGLADDDETDYASYGQRLRLGTEFKIAEGLTLNTRIDALEGRWGQFGAYGSETSRHGLTQEDDDNISFDRAWVTFVAPFGGTFNVGRQNSSAWGTIFGNNDYEADGINYRWNYGPVELGANVEKIREEWNNNDWTGPEADSDADNYHAWIRYKWNSGIAGFKVIYTNNASGSDGNPFIGTDPVTGDPTEEAGDGYKAKYWTFQPYAQAQFGPVFVEAELNYVYGDYQKWEGDGDDVDYRAWNAYVHAKADIQNFYVGGLYGYVSGDDDPNDGKYEVGPSGGRSWNPALILWNEYTNKWAGRLGSSNGANYGALNGQAMTNAHMFQLYAGMKPAPKWDVRAAVSYAMAAEEPAGYEDDEIGWEGDLTVSYKIYDNLSYTVGAGYLMAGDYFKGLEAEDNSVDDTYLLMHRLDLVF